MFGESGEPQLNQEEPQLNQEEIEEIRQRVDSSANNQYENPARTLADKQEAEHVIFEPITKKIIVTEEKEIVKKDGKEIMESRESFKKLKKLGIKKEVIEAAKELAKEYEEEVVKRLEKSASPKIAREHGNRESTDFLEIKEVEKKVMTDPTTGLRSKYAYQQEMPGLFAIEKRDLKDCSLLIIDFDKFKDVNEKYGYISGDKALKTIADALKESVKRISDSVYRVGGEEFVVFLPSANSLQAAKLAEEIRSKIEKTPIELLNINPKTGKPEKINKTVSIGCVGTDQLDEDWKKDNKKNIPGGFIEKMFNAANSSVKASKVNGRNQVTLFSKELSKK